MAAKRKKVRRCRVCKCTDARACVGGCWWVERDLCSQCDQLQSERAVVARLAERIGAVLKDAPDHDTGRHALIAVLARWVAIGALQDGAAPFDLGRHFSRATVELHVASAAAFGRMGDGWRERN